MPLYTYQVHDKRVPTPIDLNNFSVPNIDQPPTSLPVQAISSTTKLYDKTEYLYCRSINTIASPLTDISSSESSFEAKVWRNTVDTVNTLQYSYSCTEVLQVQEVTCAIPLAHLDIMHESITLNEDFYVRTVLGDSVDTEEGVDLDDLYELEQSSFLPKTTRSGRKIKQKKLDI